MPDDGNIANRPDDIAGADRRFAIGRTLSVSYATADAHGIRKYASAVGECGLIHHDPEFAAARGYAAIVAPPTYAFVLKFKSAHPADSLKELGVEGVAGDLLHAGQSFEYHEPICAGDVLRFEESVEDVYEKGNGKLLFVVLKTSVTNEDRLVCTIRHTEVARLKR